MTIVSIQVTKPTFIDIINADKINSNVPMRDVKHAWREFSKEAHEYADRNHTEFSSHRFIYAILDNGESVSCQLTVERSAYTAWAYYHKAEIETVGSLELPENWAEIHYSEWSYHCSHGGIIARKNADGKTATVFPLLNY